MEITTYNDGRTEVSIIEVAELLNDLEILDADTTVYTLDKQGSIALYINFDTGKSTIKPEPDGLIDKVATAMKSKPDLNVRLEVHIENVGSIDPIKLFLTTAPRRSWKLWSPKA